MKFAKSLLLMLIVTVAAVLTGCATSTMSKVSEAPMPKPGEASITFYRDSSFGGAISAPIAMMDSEGKLSYVGEVMNGTRVVHNVGPGHYKFVVGGESSGAMDATVEAEKYYYVEVEPHMGILRARFSLEPVSPDRLENLKGDITGCDIVVPNEAGEQWFKENFESMKEKLQDPGRTSTLKPSDGLGAPLK